ncbi:MAG: DNA polymerase I [Verrucomicrobiae bacterium]|nr:DNA polymerase I [Verrucomicrobiae bacterium]
MQRPAFGRAWVVDFEFSAPSGHRPEPHCLVVRDIVSGRQLRLWADDLVRLREAPFPTGRDSLLVSYYAPAEINCFLSLGWPLPANVVDLYAEFRNLTNGLPVPHGNGLLGALLHYGLPTMGAIEKDEMRALAIRGGPFTPEERTALLDYCAGDVDATCRLYSVMAPRLPAHALLRGRYTMAVARMEHEGVPVDGRTIRLIGENRERIRSRLIAGIDPLGEIYDGGSFIEANFSAWLARRGIAWPRLDSGRLALSEDVFDDQADADPRVRPVKELRAALAQLRRDELAIGPDGRNRCMLSPFSSISGRNQPSTSRFIFGAPSWMRRLIRPEPGMALAYIDWAQQEFGIAAALSGDAAMMQAYSSGDPYLGFAMLAGAVPQDATKRSHPEVRDIFKMVVLGVGYCMSAQGLAQRLSIPLSRAEELLELHRRCFPVFWRWSEAAADYGQLSGHIHARFGWGLHVTGRTKIRTLRNFPAQANGAEMMRLAACYATEAGIAVCAPVHDAFLIEAPADEIGAAVARMAEAMRRASADVLGGFELGSDAKAIVYPDHFEPGRGGQIWDVVNAAIAEIDPSHGRQGTPATGDTPAQSIKDSLL